MKSRDAKAAYMEVLKPEIEQLVERSISQFGRSHFLKDSERPENRPAMRDSTSIVSPLVSYGLAFAAVIALGFGGTYYLIESYFGSDNSQTNNYSQRIGGVGE